MKYSRREFIGQSGLGSASLVLGSILGCGSSKNLPNIVYILADDLGWGDVESLNRRSKIPTPNLNRLAHEGMTFTDAHSGSAVCTPTRYGILTGRYSWRSRLKSSVLFGYSPPLISKNRGTVASYLKKQGYATGCVGKWHLGLKWATKNGYRYTDSSNETGEHVDYKKRIDGGPTDLGFDYFYGIPASLDMVPYVYVENDKVVEPPDGEIEGTKDYGFYRGGPIAPSFNHEGVMPTLREKAVAYIEDQSTKKPFFLYFPLPAPHTPILPTQKFQGKSGVGPYGDFVMQCDGVVGSIMDALDKQGMADNTLLIVTSDNGCSPEAKFDRLAKKGHFPSAHHRGHKADIYEGGHRVPFIARWPGRVRAGSTNDATICLTDLLATCAAIAGRPLPQDMGEDSVSILAGLEGRGSGAKREATVHHSINGSFSIRKGKWKLSLCPGSGGWSAPRPIEAREMNLPGFQLYDVYADPSENKNVWDRHPDIVRDLLALLRKYVREGRSTPGAPQKNEGSVDLFRAQNG